MKASTLEGAAFCLVLGFGACADGLADAPGGMAVLFGGVALSGLLVHLAHTRTWDRERERTEAPRGRNHGQPVPLQGWSRKPFQGKKKAATVVTTPRRQVKQSDKASISRSYFTGAEGECQMEKAVVTSGPELAALIRRSLEGIVPSESLEFYGSENYETGCVSFNLRIRFPSMRP